jgi:uncharacterized protein (DUF302 family)
MLYTLKTEKSPEEVIETIKKKAGNYDFIIRKVFDMKEVFSSHGAEVKKGESYYSVMVCNPQRAYKTIRKNPDRGAILLQPKQIFIYRQEEDVYTTVSYMGLDKEFLSRTIPEDKEFQENLPHSCRKISDLIKDSID